MMNRFFALLLAASCLTAVGQCEVDYDCEADYDFGEAVFGISPNPQEGQAFEYGEIDEGYYDVLHILIPSFSDGIDSNLPVLPIDSLVVMESTSDDSVGYQGIWFTDTLTQENFSAGELVQYRF